MQQRFQSCREFELELNGGMTMAVDNEDNISIGRENCDINIPHQKVSRHNADISVIVKSGHNKYLFRDRSSNGTVINGRKIHNDEIEIDPQTNPIILLAGTVELRWDTVENMLLKRGVIRNYTQKASIYTTPISLPVFQQAIISSNDIAPVVKTKTKNIWLFITISIIVFFGVVTLISKIKDEKPIFEDEDGNVIFTSQKNNDSYIENLKINTKQLKKFIELGKTKDPGSEAFNEFIDDYRIELFQKGINSGEKLEGVELYLEGIPSMAGYSSAYGRYFEIDKSILLFIISFDNEYSDKSGIEFRNFVFWTNNDKSLAISKYRYNDTNELYYGIDWDEDLTKARKAEMLTSFFKKLRYADVYNDPKFDKKWFAEIYTGIEEHQQIGDLFEIK
jgi:hypothetical protein